MQHIHKRAPINVLLADDCALLRQGLRIALTAEPDLEVVAEAANGEEALHLILSLTPDVAILDIDLP
jgi:DNA-binding NarL/FixJ family response regulator